MFNAKNLFLLMMVIVSVYMGLGVYSFALDISAKIAARAIAL